MSFEGQIYAKLKNSLNEPAIFVRWKGPAGAKAKQGRQGPHKLNPMENFLGDKKPET